uniref:Peptidase C1A papain C-terminal domain-containing protein n=1 Tax=Quercus lobata TaxID=97700 RepID=A0A7N2KP23_QUELO
MSIPLITHPKSFKLPSGFDARTAWPECSTIGRILGSLWFLLGVWCCGITIRSFLNLFWHACCGFMCGANCDEGHSIYAWQYLVHHGVVTEECDPYFDDTGCSHPGCEPAYPTPKCAKKCKFTSTDQFRSPSLFMRFRQPFYRILLTTNLEFTNTLLDGYFMIRRGINECGIKDNVLAGLPSTKNLVREFAIVDAVADVSV